MGFLFRLLLLVLVVVGLVWFFREPIADRLGQRARAEAGRAGERAEKAGDRLGLDVDRIGEELKRTGRVVRRKATQVAHQLEDATRDSRTTAKIKARLALDPDLSAREISVNTTDGQVTLSGRVDSPEDVAKAIQLAMQEDEVSEVTSTMQVRRAPAGDRRGHVGSSQDAPGAIPTPAPAATPLH